ncbi:hypothetical protein DFH09DRAFT_1208675 [Mycena vulgaris]|nr:hypothetical protein DFH09DRAFT_1208675 [Mycena vulgaris]
MAPVTIKELIKEPFGPYPDYVVLNPNHNPQGTKLARLERLRLQQDGRFIGLDNCERYLAAPDKASSAVFFFGVLLIEKLDWLSQAGRILLEKELNKRDVELSGHRSSQNSRKTTQVRHLTLGGLYGQVPGQGSRIKVWIQCVKESAAMYMTARDYPTSLLINSKEQHRRYEILSIDRPVYDLSRNFLERYRLVALIAEIMATEEYNLKPNDKVEVENFVTAYLFKHTGERLSYAAIFSSDDDTPVEPLLRHVSRAEVRSIFAAHSGWLLAFYLLGRQNRCPIDIRSWCDFIHKVRVAKGASSSRNWSETYEDDEIWDPDTGDSPASIAKTLANFGDTPANWEAKLLRAFKNEPRSFDLSEDEEPVNRGPNRVTRGSRHGLTFDSDFSEASTPGCSDSEYDSDRASPPHPLPPVLWHMYQPPVLRPGRFIWDCPIPRCTHSIDLLKLSRRDTHMVKPPFDVYLQEKQYRILRDEKVTGALREMVSFHYCHKHLGVDSAGLTHQKQKVFMTELTNKWRQLAQTREDV